MTKVEEYDDRILIAQTLAGQTDSFAVLMNRHAGAVKRHINSILHNPSDNDDVIQEVMLKTWRHLASFRGECSFRSWMIRVGINEALMIYRKSRNRQAFCEAEIDVPAPEGYSPYQILAKREVQRRVRGAAAQLPRLYRQALFMRHIKEMDSQETADSLGITIPALKSRLFRARVMLADALRFATTPLQPAAHRPAPLRHSREDRQ